MESWTATSPGWFPGGRPMTGQDRSGLRPTARRMQCACFLGLRSPPAEATLPTCA